MKKIIASLAAIVIVGAALGGSWWLSAKWRAAQNLNSKIEELQKQVAELQKNQASQTNKTPAPAALPPKEIISRQIIREKSQEELLTGAVAKVGPAVVSIVISKDVPQLEVTYQNPFGDDPFFHDFGFQVPVYKQKGTVRQKVGAGTGFLITADGYILTNKHVVADSDASYTVLLADGAQKTAQVIYRDAGNDVAVVKIEGANFHTTDLGDSTTLKLGQSVIAIGNALGEYNNSVSTGIVSGLDRTIEAGGNGTSEKLQGVIQTDAAINPGNSGGPLLNLNGQVIGVNVATALGSQNISFAIPINTVKTIIAKVLKKLP